MDALSDEELVAQCRLAPASPRSRQLLDELFRRHRDRLLCDEGTGTVTPRLAIEASS